VLLDQGQKTSKLEEACRILNKAFTYCATDRLSPIETSRKWGTFAVSNLLFKTYFKLSSTNLCTTMLRSIQAAELPDLSCYPLADQVTFKYYSGVLAFLNEQYSKAEEDFVFALERCDSHAPRKNKM
jgi:hypothetical protein